MNNRGVPIEGCFSPDSKYVISGSSDGRVHAWNADTGYKVIYIIQILFFNPIIEHMWWTGDRLTQVCVLNGGHIGPVRCVQFNPTFLMMASACSHMNLWLPNINESWAGLWAARRRNVRRQPFQKVLHWAQWDPSSHDGCSSISDYCWCFEK